MDISIIKPGEGSIAVNDLLATVVACVAMVITLFLAIIGLRISNDIRSMESKLKQIEAEREGESRELRAAKSVTEIVRRLLQVSVRFDLKMHVFTETWNTEAESWSSEQKERAFKAFRAARTEYQTDTGRYLAYLLLLKERNRNDFLVRISHIMEIYGDELTIAFLEHGDPLFPTSVGDIVKSTIKTLKMRVRGIDSASWAAHE
jgi:hypothetical protein